MVRKSKISVELETDAEGRKRYSFFALGSLTCQVSVIRIKTGDNRRY